MFVKRLGVAQATQFVRFYDEAVPYVEGRMKTLGIDCDYNPSGVLRAGIHLSQEKRLRQNMALGQKLGAKTRFVDSSEMRARGIPPAFLFAAEQCGGTLNLGSMSAVCAVRLSRRGEILRAHAIALLQRGFEHCLQDCAR